MFLEAQGHEARNRGGGLCQFGVGLGASVCDRLTDAVAEVGVQEFQGDCLEGFGDGRDLGQDLDAIGVFVDHPLQTANLALDAAEPLEDRVLVVRVTAHGPSSVVLSDTIPP